MFHEEGKIQKLALVIGPKSCRKPQEIALFNGLQHFDLEYIVSSTKKIGAQGRVQYKNVVTRELLPDFIMSPFFRKPYSTTSLIQLENLEYALKNVEIISCIEFISFISAQCARIAKRNNKKLVVSVFETLTPIHKIPLYRWNVKSVLTQADLFIAYSKKSVEYLRHLSIDEDRIRMIYLGVDIKKFSYNQKKRDDGRFRILFVGAYARQKGLSTLLPAFARLCKEVQGCELWLIISQGGEDEAMVYEYMKKFPIKIFQNVDYDKLPEIYASCDLFCLPSLDFRKWGLKLWEEQFGFVLVEAMASGLPIVGSDCGSIPEIIGSSNPIVLQGSQDELFQALLKAAIDEGFRKRLSNLNRSRAEKFFDINKQREKLKNTLLEAFE
jgi:glycosyltransferase involved in cell wall biosynthesis|tara:strand:+ start:2251 stop:3399 length:1149 start_codon:yes stop_codon:yes gene_type:complete